MSRLLKAFFAFFAAAVLSFSLNAEEPQIGGARLVPRSFADLAGWAADDHRAAFVVFRRTCRPIVEDRPELRTAMPAGDDLKRACGAALEPGRERAPKTFFETFFAPYEVVPASGRGFLTGYFEPEYEGSLTKSERFATPLLAPPDDLVTPPAGETWPELGPVQAARRTARGYEPYPDRAAIEDGVLGPLARPVAYVRDAVDAFIIQVQGSARIRLPDGRTVRIAYAGKNGHAFTMVGRILVERGHVPLEEMNLERLTGWLRANPAAAREILRLNRSYVFFRLADELAPADGPIGGSGVSLTPGRSLAIDRNLWSYGLPFWIEGDVPTAAGGSERLARLLIAQDTGGAILGPARGDFFVGSGPAAGTRAGLIRHGVRFVVLRPKPEMP